MKTLSTLIFAFIVLSSAVVAQKLSANDLKVIEGEKWIGELTYLDYSSGKKSSIKSNLTVTRKADKADTWTFNYEYPDEPKANGASGVELGSDGKLFNGQALIEKKKFAGGARIVTTKEGTDNDKKALFRFTYLVAPKSFSIKKEVQIDGSTEWFERNTYTWTR